MARTKSYEPKSRTRKSHRYRTSRLSRRRTRVAPDAPLPTIKEGNIEDIMEIEDTGVRRSTRTRTQTRHFRPTTPTSRRRGMTIKVMNSAMNDPAARAHHFEKAKTIHTYITGVLHKSATEPGGPSTPKLRESFDEFIAELTAASKGGMPGTGRYWANSKKMPAAIAARGKARSAAAMQAKAAGNSAANNLAAELSKIGI